MSLISLTKNIDNTNPKNSSIPNLMFSNQVMEYFGISKSTLHRWTNVEGKLKSIKVGKRVMFKTDDVNGLVENNYNK